jgi:uncharacterized protein (DUF1684 family)
MRVFQWFLGASLLLGLALVSACSKDAPAESAIPEGNALPLVVDVEGQKQEVLDWRAERVERLQRPDGWLSLVALNWLEYGNSFVGSGATKGVRLPVGPEEVGLITLERDDTVRFKATPGAGVLIDGKFVNGTVVLRSDVDEGGPSVVSFNKGDASFVLIKRADRFGLRVRDALAPTRTGFAGIDYFDIDTSFRFNARFEAHPAGQKLGIVNVLGMEEPMDNPGVVVFEREGVEYRLEAVDEGDGRLFLIFADRTSGHETYAAARFLYAEPADAEGTTVVDFNRAYNPPCAFTAFSTCPLPPASNRLDLRIEAGEKKPRKSGTSA